MDVKIESNAEQVRAAFEKNAKAAAAGLRHGMGRGALELAREMRRLQPKSTDNLINRTGVEQPNADTWLVGTSAHYGVYTDQGSGPGGWVPNAAMDEWLRLANLTPHDPDMSEEDLRYVIQRKIYREGIGPQPWRTPALQAKKKRIGDLALSAVEAAINQAVA